MRTIRERLPVRLAVSLLLSGCVTLTLQQPAKVDEIQSFDLPGVRISIQSATNLNIGAMYGPHENLDRLGVGVQLSLLLGALPLGLRADARRRLVPEHVVAELMGEQLGQAGRVEHPHVHEDVALAVTVCRSERPCRSWPRPYRGRSARSIEAPR